MRQLSDKEICVRNSGAHEKSTARFIFAIVVLVVGIGNVLVSSIPALSYSIIALQTMILVFCIINMDICAYYLYYIAFVALSLELEAVQTKTIINIVLLEFMGISFAAILLVPLIFMTILKVGKIISYLHKNKLTGYVFGFFCVQFVISIFMGCLLLFTNDNNVKSRLPGALSLFVSHIYAYFVPLALMFVTIAVVADNPDNIERIKYAVFTILVVVGISMLISWGSGARGQYDTYDYLLASSCTFYLPCMVLMAMDFQKRDQKRAWTVIAVFFAVFACVVAPSGKSLLVFCTIPVMLLLKGRSKRTFVIFCILLIPIIILLGYVVFQIQKIYPNSLVSDKLNQIIGMLDITNPNYLAEMPLSPRCRVVEIIGIFNEYVEKPWLALFGKGFLGTFRDDAGLMVRISNAFTEAQWDAGLFYLPHETFSRLWLMSGLFGVFGFVRISFILLRNLNKSPMILGGLFWFWFFHGYSISLSVIGIAFLIVGLIDTDQNKRRNRTNETI